MVYLRALKYLMIGSLITGCQVDEESDPPDSNVPIAGESVAGESVAGESVAGESVAGESVAGESVAGESVAGESVAGESVAGESVAGESVAGELVAGDPIAGDPIAGEEIAGDPIAGEEIAGELVAGEEIAGEEIAGETGVLPVESGFLIVLRWDTPADPDQFDSEGTDLDLHLLHPLGETWNESPYDCYFANPQPDWGAQGSENDPSQDIDDVNGAGPEAISLIQPEVTDRPYKVGVLHYSNNTFDGNDYGSSTATVEVYINGALVATESRTMNQGEFWSPFEISWSEEGEGEVTFVDLFFAEIPGGEILED